MVKTMVKGTLKTWKEDRGFGFIGPENGGKDIFIHISALKGASRRPVTGDIIHYQVAKDKHGKFRAVNARIEGVEVVKRKRAGSLKPGKTIILLAISLLLIVLAAAAFYYAG